ncbi:MAG: pre-peptidase C-terminal domain-containing protein, partial [Hyphomicrobiaceae bacterium]
MVDIPNTTSTTAEVTVGGTYTGGPGGDATIETVGDHDWIRVVLAPGQAVQINLTGGTLPDPYLRLRDSNGNLVAENDDINYPANVDSQLVYYSESGGTYYIDAAGYEPGSNTGTYTISVVDIPLSGLDLGDVLDTGSTVPDNDITVYFAPAGWSQSEGGGVNIVSEGFTAYEIQQFQLAFDLIEFYTGITFTVVNDPNADFRLVLDTNQLDPYNDALAYFYFPGGGALSGLGVFSGVPWRAVDSIFDGDTDPDGDPNVLLRGGDGFATIVHELLHGLGLAHPHDSAGGSDVLLGVTGPFGSYGVSNLNQMIYTIMSYNRGWVNGAPGSTATDTYGGAGGPMAIDIAVLQQYYGAPAANTGNDIYTLPDSNGIGTYWTAIWDTAGTDEIRYDGTRDTTIDLRAATLNYQPGGGGFVSSASGIAGGFTIAQNVVIENATGGSGVDTIVGNDANNVIEGRAGGDNLDGGAGTGDTVSYASSNTGVTVNLATNAVSGGHAAGDTIANFENVIGSGFVDVLTGSSGANSLSGLAGNDTLDGGAGADALDGGADIDTVTYASSNAGVTVNLGAGTGLGGHAAGDTLANIENAIGSGFADNLIGSTGVNNLNGGGGDDTIEGGAGGDTLDGGAGTGDTVSYAGSDAGVTVNLATNSASGGHAAGDAISNFENILGSGLVDNLIGSTGDNVIEGGAGGDTMNGGLGNDTLSYASSNAGVTVNLATNTASGGHATGDTFSNFENALGSAHADTIDGSTGANVLSGGG